MKIYVIYEDLGYDGYSIPFRAFSTEERAMEYCGDNWELDWEEIELEN